MPSASFKFNCSSSVMLQLQPHIPHTARVDQKQGQKQKNKEITPGASSPTFPHCRTLNKSVSSFNLHSPLQPSKTPRKPTPMATPPPEPLLPEAEAEEEEARELLYEAYNELQALAAELGGAAAPAPAVVVVGHQTDGKSALVEALMGFQFNHVGGGTKTRRPVALHLRFNPRCDEPQCRLLAGPGDSADGDDDAWVAGRPMPLADIQTQASAVESLVRAKIQHKETIILCLEDCSDWSNATTRRVVMQVDPDLARTVLVSTKLDTKIPQFARSSDVEVFLHPPNCVLDVSLLGDSPFFTSVPSGRVGSCREAVFRSNEEFKKAISLRELEDIASIEDKLGRSLTREEKDRIGVSTLRLFLEELLQRRYIESVPLIVPLLEKEHRNATRKLHEISQEIRGNSINERINGGTFTGSENFQLPNKMMPVWVISPFLINDSGVALASSSFFFSPRILLVFFFLNTSADLRAWSWLVLVIADALRCPPELLLFWPPSPELLLFLAAAAAGASQSGLSPPPPSPSSLPSPLLAIGSTAAVRTLHCSHAPSPSPKSPRLKSPLSGSGSNPTTRSLIESSVLRLGSIFSGSARFPLVWLIGSN
ncbi:hypothetical protein PR202_ga03858 [Eleusine coracana subsp. coracana]|uniref:Dynamin-type G domain-containing protein n=1 Tax=Eleusine coracana subsp. coracana TaxID=191504 RepID=A0AAV5BPN7_ELECO|nr:hypothetical protein PR202_ga03858 [Eleusine coracana subsp. coracana]